MTLEELKKVGRANLAKRWKERKATQAAAESNVIPGAEEEPQAVETEAPPQHVETKPSPSQADTAPPVEIQLRYNPLHDLESLWWIAVYFVLQREIQSPTPDPLADEDGASWDREQQRKWADGVFYSNDFRCPIMLTPESGYFHTNVRPVVHPAVRPIVDILEDLRQDLLRRYTEVEKDLASVDFTCADGLHERFMDSFFDIEDLIHLTEDVSLVPLAAPPSLIPPATVPAASPVVPRQEGKSQIIKEAKKSTRSKKQHKRTAITPHHYNLRPRPKRN